MRESEQDIPSHFFKILVILLLVDNELFSGADKLHGQTLQIIDGIVCQLNAIEYILMIYYLIEWFLDFYFTLYHIDPFYLDSKIWQCDHVLPSCFFQYQDI